MTRTLAITAGTLGLIWLASIAVLLCYLSNIVGTPWLVGAIVAQIAVFLVASALLLVTNTRSGWLDPRAPLGDPFGETTDELLKHAVMLPDSKPYGRRAVDDRNVVARLSDILEEEAARRPISERTPGWAIDVARANAPHADAASLFNDATERSDEP